MVIYGDHVAYKYIFISNGYFYINLFNSIQFILDIELIKINIIGSSGRAFQLNHNVLKLILEDYCISLSF